MAKLPAQTQQKNQPRSALQTMFSFVRKHRKLALITCFILIARDLIEVTGVYLLSPVVTQISQSAMTARAPRGFFQWLSSSDPAMRGIIKAVGYLVASQMILSMMVYFSAIWNSKFSTRMITSIRSALYDQLQYLDLEFYDQNSSGHLMSRAMSDVEAVHAFINMSLLWTLDIAVLVIAYVVLLALRSPWLLLTAMIPVPLWLLIVFGLSPRSGPLYRQQREASDAVLNVISENINGKHVVRALGSGTFENQKFSKQNDALLARFRDVINWQATLNPLLQTMTVFSHILIFLVGVLLVQKKVLPVGDLLILGAAVGTMLAKLSHINLITEGYQKAKVSAVRLAEVLNRRNSMSALKGKDPFLNPGGAIRFENVCFSYSSGQPVLKNINCLFRPNEVTAIIGPTGSGKTTLVSLIGQLYQPTSGQIWIGTQKLVEISPFEVRKHVGYVFQETFLFSDTIANNIKYGRPEIDEDMIRQAARVANIDAFIDSLALGYQTPVGDHGVQLSGGQRQRIALARALVYDPEILILDDAMAALDASTESAIRERLRELKKSRTIILITHRRSSLSLASQVIFMDEGEILKSSEMREAMQIMGQA